MLKCDYIRSVASELDNRPRIVLSNGSITLFNKNKEVVRVTDDGDIFIRNSPLSQLIATEVGGGLKSDF